MENKNHRNQQEFSLSFKDFMCLCSKMKIKILLSMIFFALIFAILILINPYEYVVKGTFKEKSKISSGMSTSLAASFLGGAFSSNSSEALTLLKSRKIMERTVQKLGLQAFVQDKRSTNWLSNIYDNLKIEYAHYKNKSYPVVKTLTNPIQFKKVTYESETPLHLTLKFISNKTYQVWDKHQLIGEGALGQLFQNPQFSFILYQKKETNLSDQTFDVTLQPLQIVAERLLQRINIENSPKDPSLIIIKLTDHDRHFAVSLINTLMKTYQRYLKEEQNRIAVGQLSYLHERQNKMDENLKEKMEAHAKNLSSELSSHGFSDSSKAMKNLALIQNKYKNKLLQINFELKRLQNAQNTGYAHYEALADSDGGDSNNINRLLVEMRDLKQERDSLKLALKNNPLSPEEELITKSHQMISKGIMSSIDLRSVKNLYIEYSGKLNNIETRIHQNQFILDQMKDPYFEVSSLSVALEDPVSKQLINKATDLILTIKDENNRSLKEQERIKEEISLQKSFLFMHLQQSVDLLKIEQNVLRKKIRSLQVETLELIEQQITVLESHMKEYIVLRIKDLKQEANIINEHQQLLRNEMASLPSMWVGEKLIDLQVTMNKKLVEEVSVLVESKNISNNLEMIQSSPIDLAVKPLHPEKPRLFLFTALGALFGLMLTLAFNVTKTVMLGIEASKENLLLAGQKVLGLISKRSQNGTKELLLDQDFETLRSIMTMIGSSSTTPNGHTLLIIQGHGVDYSESLAELMAKKGLKVLLLPISFDTPVDHESLPGLMQYVEGHAPAPKIIHKPHFDLICEGGICRYGNEIVGSKAFNTLIQKLVKDYDWVISVTHAMPVSAQAEGLVSLYDYTVINLTGEKIQELAPYIDFVEENKEKKIGYVFSAKFG